jgi:hypothetical protein
MVVSQISVFLESRPGHLKRILDAFMGLIRDYGCAERPALALRGSRFRGKEGILPVDNTN